jgi:hypothetical protein
MCREWCNTAPYFISFQPTKKEPTASFYLNQLSMKPTKEFLDELEKAFSQDSTPDEFKEGLDKLNNSNLPVIFKLRYLEKKNKDYLSLLVDFDIKASQVVDQDVDRYNFLGQCYDEAKSRRSLIISLIDKYKERKVLSLNYELLFRLHVSLLRKANSQEYNRTMRNSCKLAADLLVSMELHITQGNVGTAKQLFLKFKELKDCHNYIPFSFTSHLEHVIESIGEES